MSRIQGEMKMNALNPPAEICGDIGRIPTRENMALVAARARWINSLPVHVTSRQIAQALCVSRDVVMQAAPGRYSRTPGAFIPATANVSLPELPGVNVTRNRPETDPRPETAHPRDIRGRRNGVTPEGFIALLRAECLRARAEA